MQELEYLDVRTAAALLGLSPKTLRRRISDDSIPAYRLGQLIRIRRCDLETVGRRIPNAKSA